MAFRIQAFDRAAGLVDRAGDWLMAREAEHNLILGILGKLLDEETSFEDPVFLGVVESGGEVVGCAVRTPPHPLVITRLPPGSAAPLAESVGVVYGSLSGVNGPMGASAAFAEAWVDLRGTVSRVGQRQRVFRLTELTPPETTAPGLARIPRAQDLPLLAQWLQAFSVEAGLLLVDPEDLARSLLDHDRFLVWHDGGPVSMAAVSGVTPNGARIGYVYTPPERRGHGYGTAVTAALTARCLEGGCHFCCLYTDVSNPTSNKIYRRLGYEPLLDVEYIEFD